MNRIMVVGCLMALVGCASPKVTYDLLKENDKGVRFQLAESLIKFDYAIEGTGMAKGQNSSKLVITSIPVPLEGTTYTIKGSSAQDNWGVSTAIKASHRNDTLLLQEIGSQITDTRKQLISDIGTVVSNALPLFAAGSADSKTVENGGAQPPNSVTLSDLIKSPQCVADVNGKIVCKDYKFDSGGVSDGNTTTPYMADIVISSRPKNAVATPTAFPMASDAVFYSACRTVTFNVKNLNDKNLQGGASLRVAEAGWVEQIALPDKGKVTFGASCGADVVAEDAALPTAVDFINTALSAAKAIKEAKDKK